MGNKNPKGYNNEDAWEKLEQAELKKKGYTVISADEDVVNFNDCEIINEEQTSEYEIISNNTNENFDEVLKEQVHEDTSFEIISDKSNNFDEVLQLTEYNEGGLSINNDFVVAEYNKVDTKAIDSIQQQKAKKFVDKITKFVLEFNDVKLTQDHEDYIQQVGELQLSNLQDLLSLVEINKQMINNIVARVNAVQAEDYAIIAAYNNLVNQHIKLIKEVSNTYKSIPSVIKKMRADVLSNQELEASTENEEVITEEFGDKQFNNSKQLLKSILAKRNAKIEQQQNEQNKI